MVDLEEVIATGGVAYFGLSSDRYPELSRLVGAALIVDLVTLSSDLQGRDQRAVVFIDEFASVGSDRISRLFATGRAAGMSVLLATQGLADLAAARHDGGQGTLMAQVLQNVDHVIAHRQAAPESAKVLSEVAGTYATWVLTRQFDDPILGAARAGGTFPTRAFIAHPDEFKKLSVGEAIVLQPLRQRAQRVSVWPPD
jgi:type IV secretory pathway TraG/TraD family ATPase VirD4